MAYQPIENYGMIGDMHSVALVGTNGSIDWLCWPRFDSPSVFASILDDKKGGSFRIAPTEADVTCKQFYWPATSVPLRESDGAVVADFTLNEGERGVHPARNERRDLRRAFVQHYGNRALDAANLMMPLTLFVSPTDPRMLDTLDAMLLSPEKGGLVANGLVYRYNVVETNDGLRGEALGNFPQAFTHLALISAATNLDRALGSDA